MSPDWSAKEEPVPYAQLDDPQSLNLYSYGLNNPLSLIDGDGHSTDTYHVDMRAHGAPHIDRRTKNGETVGRYNADGSPIKHGKTANEPIPNADKEKFQQAADELNKKIEAAKAQAMKDAQDFINQQPPMPPPPLPDGLKPDPKPIPDPLPPITPFPIPSPSPVPTPTPTPVPTPTPLPFPMPEPMPVPI